MLERDYYLDIRGRTIAHLGKQLYKKRDAAIAEYVANAWDAGATCVSISLPEIEEYDRATSSIVVMDNGLE